MLLSGQTKDITNTYGYKYPLNAHGSAITDTIHLMAPQARLLLIDLYSISGQHLGDKNIDAVMAQAIDKAIDHGVDVINLSQNVKDTPEMVAACQRAAQKGIPIIIAAGNDSTKSNPVLISKSAGDLFNKVEGKGIRFVGALKYGKNGEEKQTSYTQLPDEKTQKHVLFAAGNNFPVRYNLADPDKLDGGTCWATAAATAGCALTIGMADMMGYQASSEELLDIMFDAGRNVNHKFTPVRALLSRPTQAPALVNVKRPYKGQSFSGKSMDLWNTKLAIEAKIAAAPKTLRALPVAPVVRNVRALPIVPR